MGTPALAAVSLQELLNNKLLDIVAVITKPDSCSGRNLLVNKSPVKLVAEKQEKEIKILQPEKIKDIIPEIEELNPELIVVVAYGKILPKRILDIPKYSCLNVHGSLLPKYRGASCIQGPILNGDKTSGITIMKMDEGMDTGDIIKKVEINLDENETGTTLLEKIIELAKNNISPIISDYIIGNLKPEKQNEAEATYVTLIEKEAGHLNFTTDTATEIERKIRAYSPWPGTYAFVSKTDLPKEKILFKIQKSDKQFKDSPKHLPGEIFAENGVLYIKTKDLAIRPEIVQLEGKKALVSDDFLKGNAWIIGKRLE